VAQATTMTAGHRASRHDYRISALQQNILLEVPSLGDLAVAEANGGLTRALAVKHANVVGAGNGVTPPAMLIACITSIGRSKGKSPGLLTLPMTKTRLPFGALTETVTTAPGTSLRTRVSRSDRNWSVVMPAACISPARANEIRHLVGSTLHFANRFLSTRQPAAHRLVVTCSHPDGIRGNAPTRPPVNSRIDSSSTKRFMIPYTLSDARRPHFH